MSSNWIIGKNDLILLTGANGFIGSKVLEILLEYGFTKIRCFIRSDRNLSELNRLSESVHANVEYLRGNLLSSDDCQKAVKDASLILHLAAGTGKSFAACFMNSVLTTRNILEAVRAESNLRRFVSISSLSVYSGIGLRRGAVLKEDSKIEEEHMSRYDPYCYGKIKQDELVVAYGKKYGLPYTIVRPGPVYGPGKRSLTGRVGIDSFGVFIHIGGSNRIPIIYIDNCAEAIVLAGIVEGVNGEVFIAVDDELPTSRQFLRLFKKNVRRFFSFNLPYGVFYLLCYLWEKYSQYSDGQLPPIFNRRQCAAYYKKQIYSNQKLKDRTGWKPRVSFVEASKNYFDYMRSGEEKR